MMQATLESSQREALLEVVCPLPVIGKRPCSKRKHRQGVSNVGRRAFALLLSAIFFLWMTPLMGFMLLLTFPAQESLDKWLGLYSTGLRTQGEASYSALLTVQVVLLALYAAMRSLPTNKIPSIASLHGVRLLNAIEENYQRSMQREHIANITLVLSMLLMTYHMVGVFGTRVFMCIYAWHLPEEIVRKIMQTFTYDPWIHFNYLFAQIVLFIATTVAVIEVGVPLADSLGTELKRTMRLRELWGLLVRFQTPTSKTGRWISITILMANIGSGTLFMWSSGSAIVLAHLMLMWMILSLQWFYSFQERSKADRSFGFLRWTLTYTLLFPTISLIKVLLTKESLPAGTEYTTLTWFLMAIFIVTTVIMGTVRPHVQRWDFTWERKLLSRMTLRGYCRERELLASYLDGVDDTVILPFLRAQEELEKKNPILTSECRLLLGTE